MTCLGDYRRIQYRVKTLSPYSQMYENLISDHRDYDTRLEAEDRAQELNDVHPMALFTVFRIIDGEEESNSNRLHFRSDC